jgi:hypothetical protein
MSEDLKDLEAVADAPDMVVAIGGQEYPIAPLRPIDIVKAQKFLNAERRKEFCQSCRGQNPLPEAVMADTLARMACQPVTLSNLLDNWEGRLMLLHLSLVRGGHSITFKALCETMGPIEHQQLIAAMEHVTGLRPAADTDGDGPPTISASSSADPTGNK